MSEESKPYPASELKLERLRDDGVVPYSQEVESAAIVLGLFAVVLLFGSLLCSKLMEFATEAFAFHADEAYFLSAQFKESSLAAASSTAETLVFALGLVLLPLFLAVFVLGLLQTRFLFVPAALRFRLSSLFSLGELSPAQLFPRFSRSLVSASLFVLSLVLSFILLRYFFTEIADSGYASLRFRSNIKSSFAGGDKLPLLAFVESMTYFAGGALAFFSVMLGVGAYFVRVLGFKRIHRMSRAELEAEYREMETSPELRSAQRERLVEPES